MTIILWFLFAYFLMASVGLAIYIRGHSERQGLLYGMGERIALVYFNDGLPWFPKK